MARTAQGHRAASCPRLADVQSPDSSLWARFPALVRDCGPILRGEAHWRTHPRPRRDRGTMSVLGSGADGGLIVLPDAFTDVHREQITTAIATLPLPAA